MGTSVTGKTNKGWHRHLQRADRAWPPIRSEEGLEGRATIDLPPSWPVLGKSTNTFHSCTNPFLAVLKNLIAMQGCGALLNKISPSGLFLLKVYMARAKTNFLIQPLPARIAQPHTGATEYLTRTKLLGEHWKIHLEVVFIPLSI